MMPTRCDAGRPLVVGLGSPDRGDDAVGPVIARHVGAASSGVQVVEREDPTSLIELWCERELAIVADAVRSNGTPGTVMIVECGVGGAPLTDDAWARTGRGGTHAFGLGAAVELARALNRLPRRLVLIGVEAGCFEYGYPLSPSVRAAVGPAVEAVLAVLDGAGGLPRDGLDRSGGGGPGCRTEAGP